jgi:hypothetical protein
MFGKGPHAGQEPGGRLEAWPHKTWLPGHKGPPVKRPIAFGLLALSLFAADNPYRDTISPDHPAVHYNSATPTDPAAPLLTSDTPQDLPGLLTRFHIPQSSQMLVFSKDSFQAPRISPHNPRAVYFTDDIVVAFVRGSQDLEIAATDPKLGPMFYKYSGETKRVTREAVCLHCHQGAATLGVPGIFVGSVFPNSSGAPSRDGAIITDHRTPFADRWGGWYVTAVRGEQADRANGVAPDPAEPRAIANDGRRNLVALGKLVNLSGYLEATSDIVALMTFEHQTQMTNLMTRVAWESRVAEASHGAQPDVRELVDYMTFKDEVPLPEPVEGASRFTAEFAARGPRDRQGRSLRDFDLRARLFRYPVSYMIYSAQFNALPEPARANTYRRLYDQLAVKSPAAIEILRDTKPDLPEYWRTHE